MGILKPWTACFALCLALSLAACGEDSTAADPGAGGAGGMGDAGGGMMPADAGPQPDADLGDDPDAAPEPDAFDPGPLITVEEALDHVDPFIGSGGIGFNHGAQTPAAQVPNGLVKLGPDTTRAGSHPSFHHFSGYHFDDPDVRGFSHTRLVGTGIQDLGNFRVQPRADLDAPGWTPMDKATEAASPGFYSVHLPDVGVQVELTAARLAGLHRYTFEAPGWLEIDAGASIPDEGVRAASLTVEGARVEGSVTFGGPMTGRNGGEFTLWIAGTLDPPPEAVEALSDQTSALRVGAGVTELRVGVSLLDQAQAWANHAEQVEGQSFEAVQQAARAAWAEKIGRLQVAGGDERARTLLYTAMYHTWTMPTGLHEGRRHRGIDGEIHTLERPGGYFTDLSLWDTFRTLHPWYVLVDQELQRDALNALLEMAQAGGAMPRWPSMTTYGGSMIGSSADHLFAGSALKGIDGVDYAAAFELMLIGADERTAPIGRRSIAEHIEFGYVPADVAGGAVSRSVEYVWADASLGQLAAWLEHPAAERLIERGGWWRNMLDEEGFLAPRDAEGAFMEFTPTAVHMGGDAPYVEGSAWHWRFGAFHDPEGLAEALGGPAALGDVLDEFFQRSGLGDGRWLPTRPDPYYWHGNEPDLHAVWLYHATDRPEEVGRWVRAIQDRAYGTGPDGLVGNDDGGTLSAWFIFSALGLYPSPGTDLYYLGPPLFPRAVLHLADRDLIIEAPGAPERWRVGSVTSSEAEVSGGRIRHSDLLNAGILNFEWMPEP